MKKQLFVAILILFPFLVQAQDGNKKNIELGFSLTPNIGWLRFNDTDPTTSSNGSRVGFSYGILADFGLAASNNYYFSTAFTLSSINGKATTDFEENGVANNLYKLQYIEVPFTIKLKSNATDVGRFYGQFGLGTGLKIGAKADVEGVNAQNDINISKDINNFRLSLIAGGGAEWTIDRNVDIQTGITFNNGFTDIFDGAGNARNSYFALNLGIFF